MKSKINFNFLLKLFISIILAFIILTIFCYFYYNIPSHKKVLDNSTDYKWESNKFYSRGTEGFAFGKTNNDGYINIEDYNEDTDVDILILGSSHMESYEVLLNETTTSQLNILLGGGLYAYNIGISGHTFLTCYGNLSYALKKYNPSKYVIIETSNIIFDEGSLNEALNGTFKEIESRSEGILAKLSENPFLRIVYKQLKGFIGKSNNDDEEVDNFDNDFDKILPLMDEILNNISIEANKYGIKPIILYHPSTKINVDGSLELSAEIENIDKFRELCDKNNITLLDMSGRFRYEYYNNHILPYGFSNTTIGTGHLNKYGHKMIAEELYKIIKGVE